jgi:hypothetical protein
MKIGQISETGQKILELNIPKQAVDAASEVIKKGSSPADRGELSQALSSFETAVPAGFEDRLNARIYGDFKALQSAVRLAHSVTHAEPSSPLARFFKWIAGNIVSSALERATPTNRANLDTFAKTLEQDYPAVFYAAKVCVAMGNEPRNDINASF